MRLPDGCRLNTATCGIRAKWQSGKQTVTSGIFEGVMHGSLNRYRFGLVRDFQVFTDTGPGPTGQWILDPSLSLSKLPEASLFPSADHATVWTLSEWPENSFTLLWSLKYCSYLSTTISKIPSGLYRTDGQKCPENTIRRCYLNTFI